MLNVYSTVFGAPPTVAKSDYAKWMLEDPRINFAISKRGSAPGIDHLGVQVESDQELAALREQVSGAHIAALDQPDSACCYARADKYWTTDPQGIAWETFHTLESILVYSDTGRAQTSACRDAAPSVEASPNQASACCAPRETL